MAEDLADDIRDVRAGLDRDRIKDVRKSAERMRERLNERVADGELEPALAARLDNLLQILLRLTENG